jgi:ABC-type polysaccharide/polyol phosphate export permease
MAPMPIPIVRRAMAEARALIAEQIEYRELLLQMTRRDLLLRYKQTIMGFGWAVFMPLINTVIFSVVFTRVAPIETGLPYPLYAFSGLLAWNFMASSLRFAVVSLTGNANLVTKIYFPREVFPFSAVLVAFVDSAIASLVLVVLMAWYGVGLSWTVALLPVVVLVHMTLTAALALLLALGNLFYRDVKYLFEIVLSVAMFATSVVYPVDQIGGTLGRILSLNPVTTLIDAYRSVLLRGTLPPAGPFLATAVISALLLMTAWALFHRGEMAFAENI